MCIHRSSKLDQCRLVNTFATAFCSQSYTHIVVVTHLVRREVYVTGPDVDITGPAMTSRGPVLTIGPVLTQQVDRKLTN